MSKKIERQIAELESQQKEQDKKIAELREQLKKSDWRNKLVRPSEGKYFYLESSETFCFKIGRSNYGARKPEHAFATEEQAELIKEKMLLMQEMFAFAHVVNKEDGFVADWKNFEQGKCGVCTNNNKAFTESWDSYNYFVFGIAVGSEKRAKQMLSEFGERINKYYNVQY